MDGVPKWVEDRRNIQRDTVMMAPDIGHRQRNVFGERTRPVDPDSVRMGAQVAASGQTVTATSAHHVTLTAHQIAREEIGDVGTGLHYASNEFMAYRHGNRDGSLRPIVPFVNVNIRAADTRAKYFDQYIVDPDLRTLDFFQPQPRLTPALH